MAKFFEHGGGRFFISVTTSRTRGVYSTESNTCTLVKDWEDVIEHLRGLTEKIRFQSHLELIEIFTKPRLCEDCMKHAVLPLMFDEAKAVTECLCWIEGEDCHKLK